VLVTELTCTMRDRGPFQLSEGAIVLSQVKVGSLADSSSARLILT